MAGTQLKAAILIISDTAFNDPSTDTTGAKLVNVFAQQGSKWDVKHKVIVPDEVGAIQQYIHQFCDDDYDFMNFVVTSGGTGFAIKDLTPEAVKPMIDKEAPGLM